MQRIFYAFRPAGMAIAEILGGVIRHSESHKALLNAPGMEEEIPAQEGRGAVDSAPDVPTAPNDDRAKREMALALINAWK